MHPVGVGVSVNLCRVDTPVTERLLDASKVRYFKESGSEGVAQRMRRDALAYRLASQRGDDALEVTDCWR